MALRKIVAPEGKIYTDGNDVWSQMIYLSATDSEDNYRLVDIEEYLAYRKAIEESAAHFKEKDFLGAINDSLNDLT